MSGGRTGNAFVILAAGVLVGGAAYAGGTKEHQLGPTGLIGTISKTTIKVTKVAKGSPASGRLKPGDQIVGAGGSSFKKDVRREMADAIDEAETEEAEGRLTLTLKGGKKVDLKLKVLGTYSDTAPFDCPKTDAVVTQTADYLVKTKKFGRGGMHIGLLGLLATGEQKYIDVVKGVIQNGSWANPGLDKLMEIVSGERDGGYVGWYWGYTCLLLCEYHLLTGDESALPGIKAYATAVAMGQDAGGLWGHRMAMYKLNDGARHARLPGYAQINQPSLVCFLAVLLADKCGVTHPEITMALKKTHAFYANFIGKGALNYGVHGPNTKLYNNNGTSGSAAVAFAVKGNRKGASFFSRLAATSHGGLETGHTGHFFNVMWTPLGANVAGPEVTSQFFKRSRWLRTLYRTWDGGFTFDGGSYRGCSDAGAHLLAYCIPRRKLYITGKKADESVWLKGREATDAIELSAIDYGGKTDEELLAMFGHPIPHVPRRAVWTLRSREHKLLDSIKRMIREGTARQRQSAIGYFGYGCPKEVAGTVMEDLGSVLRDTTEYPGLRAAAAGALCWLGEPAYGYYEDMLKLVVSDEPDDPFFDVDESVGRSLNILCKDPYKAGMVKDKKLFYAAVDKLLDHKRQWARSSGMAMIANVPLEDFHVVADKILYIVEDRDRTYQSYHNQGPRGGGITVLANLNVKEGISYLLDTLDTKTGKWGFKVRMLMGVLPKYGANAQAALAKLRADPRLKNVEKGKFGRQWKAMAKAIESAKKTGDLIGFEEARQFGPKNRE